MRRTFAVALVAFGVACGSTRQPALTGDYGFDSVDAGDDSGIDAGNGNGLTGNMSGTPPVASSCGMVDRPQSQPLALPDTNQSDGSQPSCTSNAQCSGGTPNCVITADAFDGGPGYCSASFVDTLQFVGFGAGATLTDPTRLISVCATLEHSWLGDLQIELISPDGKSVALRKFVGRTLAPYFLGHPNYCDDDATPVPGVGYKYCWTAAAKTGPLTADSSTCAAPNGCEQWDGSPVNTCATDDDNSPPYQVVPAGNYLPDVPFSALKGAELNGAWTFRVTDLWQEDDGFLFDWSIQFDASLVTDCSSPLVK